MCQIKFRYNPEDGFIFSGKMNPRERKIVNKIFKGEKARKFGLYLKRNTESVTEIRYVSRCDTLMTEAQIFLETEINAH